VPIRILHVVEAVGVGGGVENGIANIINGMAPDRFEHVLCGIFRVGQNVERYPLDRVRLIGLDQKQRRWATQVGPLARLIREVQPDIVHSRNWGAIETVVAARWVRSFAVVHSEHGFETNPESEARRRSLVRRVGFELAHRVFSVSYQLRDALALRTGFARDRIAVIHNGVSTIHFRPDRKLGKRFRAEFGIPESDFCIGCVGRLNRIKNYPTLLRAARILASHCDDWRILIAGQGAEFADLRDLIDGSPELRQRAMLLGSISRIPEFLNALDVFALPSLWEGISNALLEAMATGLPVVTSAVGGNLEVIVDGQSGILFPVGDAKALAGVLVRLSREPESRRKLGNAAIQRVNAKFSLDSMIRKYEEMYEGLARKGVRELGPEQIYAS